MIADSPVGQLRPANIVHLSEMGRHGTRLLARRFCAQPLLRKSHCGLAAVQSGADRFALMAFQLFTLPLEFTLNALFALPLSQSASGRSGPIAYSHLYQNAL